MKGYGYQKKDRKYLSNQRSFSDVPFDESLPDDGSVYSYTPATIRPVDSLLGTTTSGNGHGGILPATTSSSTEDFYCATSSTTAATNVGELEQQPPPPQPSFSFASSYATTHSQYSILQTFGR